MMMYHDVPYHCDISTHIAWVGITTCDYWVSNVYITWFHNDTTYKLSTLSSALCKTADFENRTRNKQLKSTLKFGPEISIESQLYHAQKTSTNDSPTYCAAFVGSNDSHQMLKHTGIISWDYILWVIHERALDLCVGGGREAGDPTPPHSSPPFFFFFFFFFFPHT